jgi:hypothetical protein
MFVGLVTINSCPAQETPPSAQDKKPDTAPGKGGAGESNRGNAGGMAGFMSQMQRMGKPDAAPAKEGAGMAGMMSQMRGAMGGRMGQPAKPAQPAEPTLEEMLNKALKDNPDIRVAEAKVREADAELNRTRLQVTQKVLAFHHSRESQKAIVKVAEEDLQRIQKLEANKAVSVEEVKQAQQRLSASKAKLAEIEAEMPYLLGQQTKTAALSATFSPDTKTLYSTMTDGTIRAWDATTGVQIADPAAWQTPVLNLGQQPSIIWLRGADGNPAKPVQETGTIADKIRKALDMQVTVDYKQKSIHDILGDLKKKVPGLSIHDLSGVSQVVIDVHIDGQVPVRTALEMLEDTASAMTPGRLSFVLRDYGLLFAPNASLPPDAVHINNLSRGVKLTKPENEKAPAKDEKKPSAEEKKQH